MITVEKINLNGTDFYLTKSDTFQIQKIGTEEIYSEAIDLFEHAFEYKETDMLLGAEPDPEPEPELEVFQEPELTPQQEQPLTKKTATSPLQGLL